MTTNRPNVDERGLYSQAQAAQALGVSRQTIRRYAEAGHLAFRVRRANSRPVITGAQIIRCWERMYL